MKSEAYYQPVLKQRDSSGMSIAPACLYPKGQIPSGYTTEEWAKYDEGGNTDYKELLKKYGKFNEYQDWTVFTNE